MQENYKDYTGAMQETTTEELVTLYQSTGNEEYLKEIVTRNNGLIKRWAYDYRNIPYYEEEDLEAEGFIALWKAVESFDPSRGMKFTSCLKGCVRQAYNRLYNEVTRQKRFTGCEPVSYEELGEIHKEGFEVDDYTEIEIREFIDTLVGTAKTVAVMLVDGFSKGEIAKELKITPASTSYHLKRLRNTYLAYGEGLLA